MVTLGGFVFLMSEVPVSTAVMTPVPLATGAAGNSRQLRQKLRRVHPRAPRCFAKVNVRTNL